MGLRRKHLFTEREALARGGLPPLVYDEVPATLRGALHLYLSTAPTHTVRSKFHTELAYQYGLHFGAKYDLNRALATESGRLNDFLELVITHGLVYYQYKVPSRTVGGGIRHDVHRAPALPNVEEDLNVLFDRHRYGYRAHSGEILRIDSPMLQQEVVGPALLAAARPGWEEVERQYRDALHHQRRSDESGDAVTAATAAVEAALRASDLNGSNLAGLLKSFRNSPLATGFSPAILEHWYKLAIYLMQWRSAGGQAHPLDAGANPPPPEVVALAVHWAGALIVFLAARSPHRA